MDLRGILIRPMDFFCKIKANHTIADLRHGEKDTISPSTLIFDPIKD